MDHYANQMITESEQSEISQENDLDDIDTPHSNENVDDDTTEDTVCSDCNENALNDPENGFILPCEFPHCLIWAKKEHQFYRPAKVVLATFNLDDDAFVRVRFFGDHLEADVPIAECFLFSEKRPEDSEIPNHDLYDVALKVSLIINFN